MKAHVFETVHSCCVYLEVDLVTEIRRSALPERDGVLSDFLCRPANSVDRCTPQRLLNLAHLSFFHRRRTLDLEMARRVRPS